MKKGRIVAALLCASLGLTTGAVFAQPAPGGPGQYHDSHDMHGDMHGDMHASPQGGPDHGPGMDAHQPPRPPEHADDGPRHADWHKGERLSSDYRNRQYVVDNWHEHGLRQPPRGYQWVGVGGDYLLVAAASGVIAQVILSH